MLPHATVMRNWYCSLLNEVCLPYPPSPRRFDFLSIGASSKTLNKELLTPFHASIKAGNLPVVRFIMERRGKSFDGYHPSKAAPSGQTPLQLAIESGVAPMVDLFVKDATTHDVARCWKTESMSEEIRDILRTKVGIYPFLSLNDGDKSVVPFIERFYINRRPGGQYGCHNLSFKENAPSARISTTKGSSNRRRTPACRN